MKPLAPKSTLRARNRVRADTDAASRLLTVQEAAENWRISVRQLRRMISAGELPVVRFGRAVRINPKHLSL